MDRTTLLDHGATLYREGALSGAEAAFRQILADAPDDPEVLSNLGGVLNAAQCHDAAEAACRRALAVSPGYWAALANLATALHRQDRHQEAVPVYIEALNANPANAACWSNLGIAMAEQWQMQRALTAHEAAIKLAPENADLRTNRAIALLAAGDYARGFAEWEWRWRCPNMQPHGFTAPRWMGEPVEGKMLLVHAEGGFGDTLQFVRFVPLLMDRGVRFTLRVQAPLLRLLRRAFPMVPIIADSEPVPPHDYHCPLLSVPHVLGTTLDTVPARIPYLVARPEATRAWKSRLARFGDPTGKLIGLCWAGSPLLGHAQGRVANLRRSMDLSTLAPLGSVPGVRFVSLQAGGVGEAPKGLQLFDAMPEMTDFDDTAALVAALDLVITVDTAVAHLAGALGRPVWVLSRFDACWRWLANRSDSPWYRTLRLFRQDKPGAWEKVVESVRQELLF
jgi:hypothetical protein